MAHGDKLRAARAALPREKFEQLFKQGLSDQEIADAAGVAYHHAVRFKKEYGFTGIIGRGGRNQFKKKELDTMYIDDNVTPAQENEQVQEECCPVMEDGQGQDEHQPETSTDTAAANFESKSVAQVCI